MAQRGRRSGRGRGRGGSKSRRDRTVDLERYRGIMPDFDDFLAAAARPEPTVFRVRRGRITDDELLARLEERGFTTTPLSGLPGFYQVVDGPGPVSMTPEHWLGLMYIQQASTGVAAPALGVRPGERVLDMCAAPGGKTTHMAELMGDRGCIVASEISEPRIRGLLGNVYRLGHPNILVVAGDGRDFPEGALFDRVLLDAPCSGEGTLRRSRGQAPNQSASFIGYVTRAQRELLERACRLTRPGGTILYVTCTFSPEENEAVVSDGLATLPLDLEPLDLPVPHAKGLTSYAGTEYDPRLEGAARIYPQHLDSGGLFLARLRKVGDDGEMVRDDSGAATESEDAGDEGGAGSAGWGPVPELFPDREAAAEVAAESDSALAAGSAEVAGRFGLEEAFGDVGWTMRGGRAWLHTLDEWPLESWAEGPWRPISVGIRALDFDSRGRARPTNDLLRWASGRIEKRVTEVDDATVRALLGREAVPTEIDDRGPIALRWRGDVIGRGAVTEHGLKSEIPKARANDLKRILGDPDGAGS